MLTVKIKEEALELFCKQGYECTTMRQIARTIGIKAASIYNHYSSKKELFLTILREIADKDIVYIRNQMRSIKTTNITLERYLFYVFQSHVRYYKENREESMFWLNFSLFPPEEVKEEIVSLNHKRMEEVCKACKPLHTHLADGNTVNEKGMDIIQNYFSVMMYGYLAHMVMGDIEFTDKEIEETWGILWKGLKI